MDKEKIIAIAAEILKTDKENARNYCEEIPEINGWYFWQPQYGGISVLINSNGEKLAATSSVSLKEHIAEFNKGRRN